MRWVPVAVVAVLLAGCKSEEDRFQEERNRLVTQRTQLQQTFDKTFAGRAHATFTPAERALYDSIRDQIGAINDQINATYRLQAVLPSGSD